MSQPAHLHAAPSGLALGQVTDTQDPQGRGRVRLKLLQLDLDLWASVAVPSAGARYGVALLPKIGEVVVVGFLGGEHPVVLGALWAGDASQPEDADPVQDRYAIATPAGTVLLMDDGEGPSLSITTPAGNSVTITDAAGGKITASVSTTTIEVTTSEISLTATTEVKIEAPRITLSATSVNIDAGMTSASGVVRCDTAIATSVVGSTYTPGAGNIW